MRDRLRAAPPADVRRTSTAAIAPASATPRARIAAELLEANRRFYDSLWTDARLVDPARFNTWPLVRSLLAQSRCRLEVAPGLRPRLPIEGTHVVDFSAPALARLREGGARAVLGLVTSIPFPDACFDLVCAFDIIEHADDDEGALSELSRVAAPGATFLLSVPLHPSRWTSFDELVGHRRRYEPERICAQLAKQDLSVERSAAYGMQPPQRLLDLGMWFLTHRREKAMWWYNRVMMPIGLRFQSKLALASGWIDTAKVDEILLVCRKGSANGELPRERGATASPAFREPALFGRAVADVGKVPAF